MRAGLFLRRVPISGVRDSYPSRLLGPRTAWISVGVGGNIFKGLFFLNHLSLQVDDITPGGNSVKIFKEFRECPGRVMGRGH